MSNNGNYCHRHLLCRLLPNSNHMLMMMCMNMCRMIGCMYPRCRCLMLNCVCKVLLCYSNSNQWDSYMLCLLLFVCNSMEKESKSFLCNQISFGSSMLMHVRMIFRPVPATNRRLDSAKKGGIKMQKSGINFWELMPRTIVPLDSAFVNLVYAMYSTAFSGFLQVCFLYSCCT